MKYHYVYRITNKENNKHYYGVRSSKIEPKLDLGIKYFSSSTDKEFINEQKTNKDKFKYKIIKTFDTRKEAELIEVKLHTKFEVQNNDNFYNKAKSTLMGFSVEGRKQTREHIEKRIKGYAGKTFEEIYGVDRAIEIKEILSRPKSEEHKKKLSLAKTGVKLTPEHAQAVTNAIKLRYLDENYKEKFTKTMTEVNKSEEKRKLASKSLKELWSSNEDFKNKMKNRKSHFDTIIVIKPNGEMFEYNGLNKLAKEFNFNTTMIRDSIKNDKICEITKYNKNPIEKTINTVGYKFLKKDKT